MRASPACRPSAGRPWRATLPMRVNSERGRTEYLLVGLVQRRRRPRGLPDGQGLGLGHDVQPRRRLRHDRPAHRVRSTPAARFRSSCSASDSARRPGHHRQPLRRPRPARRRAGAHRACARSRSTSAAWAASPRRGAASATSPASTCSIPRPASTTAPADATRCARARATAGCRASSSAPATRASQAGARRGASPPRSRDPDCVMVNRNPGSGTRILIDRLLGDRRPPGYACRRSRTTPSPPRCARVAPTGVSRSPRSRSLSAWASCRCRRSNTTSSFPGRAPRARRPSVSRRAERPFRCASGYARSVSTFRADSDCGHRRFTRAGGGRESAVLLDERRDEEIAVVVTVAQPQVERHAPCSHASRSSSGLSWLSRKGSLVPWSTSSGGPRQPRSSISAVVSYSRQRARSLPR